MERDKGEGLVNNNYVDINRSTLTLEMDAVVLASLIMSIYQPYQEELNQVILKMSDKLI